MRVAIVGDYPLNETVIWGGVEAAFAYLVKELAQLDDLELHVVTLANSGPTAANGHAPNGTTFHVLPPFPRFEFARNFRTYQARLDRTLAEIKPDLVHAQGATDHAYGALRSGYPTVITVHGVQSEDSKHQGTFRTRARKWLYGLLIERYNLSHTRHLIAIGRYVAEYFRKQMRADAQVYFVPNAIDESYFHLSDLGTGSTILYAGRVIRRKRTLDLVYAFAKVAERMPSAHLRIAGEYDSEPAYGERVRQQIAASGLTDRVEMLGGLSEHAIQREFEACDVLALPSIQETTPMVIAEAMAAGKPVVATPVGGVAEMVRDRENGFLVPVGDTDRLADALLNVLGDPGLRARMSKAGREFAAEHYRAASVARRTRDVYARIAAGT
ncbi:MAG: glycosyltransferase family 4 protein [Chloroflexi bacterium]|nr:glycosyltransferase family 4 protein [Chloroflexota bacterium]